MWDKTNKKYAKLCWITNKIFIFYIIVLSEVFKWKKKYEKFNPNFFCFAKSPILFYKIYERAEADNGR